MGFPSGSAGKESASNVGDMDSIPGLGRSPEEGNRYPLQYSGLEKSRIAKSWTQLSDFHYILNTKMFEASQWLSGKESACNARDGDSIPGSGRTPGGGNGNPFQYSSLENSHGQRSLRGNCPWGHKESDMTEVTRWSRVATWLCITSLCDLARTHAKNISK